MTVTRRDVAKLAGVSTAVVSYVINDGPRAVSPSLRDRVLAAISELNYRPNDIARALSARRTRTIGLITPDNTNPFFAELAKAIEDVAFDYGHTVLLGNSTEDPARERTYIDSFFSRRVDGLLLISVRSTTALTAELPRGLPIVLLDRAPVDVDAASVTVDNVAGTATATEHLIGHGHLNVGLIAGPVGPVVSRDREQGWRQAIVEAGLDPKQQLIVRAPFTRPGGQTGLQELLSHPNPPTAIVVSSDTQGVGAFKEAAMRGLRIPADLAVVSIDGTEQAEFTVPGLTAMRQPVEAIARAAVMLLIDDDDGPLTPRQHIQLPFGLHRRGSCGCVDDSTDESADG